MQIQLDKIKIRELLGLRHSQMLTVNPEYQRGAVWADAQQKRLVDSVLRGYPLPLIYLHYKKISLAGMSRESLEIIDGQQRINALSAFADGGFKLFDPVKDDKKARFPEFIKNLPCPWAQCDYVGLPAELKDKFNNTEIFIVKVTTDNEDEARDLFIRLQAGLPLNPQEKRDAWPGGFTEFVLRYGGKREISRYPGHEFFRRIVANKSTDRGDVRTLCAQIAMLFFSNATKGNWMDLGTQAVDEYYYQKLGFDTGSAEGQAFVRVLDLAYKIFERFDGSKLKANEAIHNILLIESLMDDYAADWQHRYLTAFEKFRLQVAVEKRQREGEFWYNYGALTMTQAANALTIQRRHSFFARKMMEWIQPIKKDEIRGYGRLEREIIYYRDGKKCAVCDFEITWDDLEIHHIEEHHAGGQTTLENGVAVHKKCHPKGFAAPEFKERWVAMQHSLSDKSVNNKKLSAHLKNISGQLYKLENLKKGIVAFGKVTDDNKFCVLKGSTVSPDVSETFAAKCPIPSNKRKKYYREGIIDPHNTFTEDVTFKTKSGAASLVLGYSANGNVSWVPCE